MERDKKRQTDRHMTRDLECQEFQKRGERKRERERERERKKERDILQMCTHLYLYFFTVTRSSLLALSSHVGLSLSLSLSLFVCVYECGRVLVCCPLLIPSSSLSQSLSQTYTHTVEQSKIIDVKQLLDCGQKKCSKRASWKHAHARASSHAQTRAHKKGYKLTEYTSLVCLV
jgi:hypothetical protein